ncbi:MAG: hypothetical protein KDE56_10675 [Anaerolineales bacterium]|nr:hypothetical protein [Anaerolineales bacterium]
MTILAYTEETFGILTDDQLYLDCVLVKPAATPDHKLQAIRVWVPKYPLTKDSVLVCAQHQVNAGGPDGSAAHLVFDLRGTGYSDGFNDDTRFELDLHAVGEWAKERFPQAATTFLGSPTLTNGRVYVWPLREGGVIESYYYPPAGRKLSQPCLLYLATYGQFAPADDAICDSFAAAGFAVYGLDPLRYLLHASGKRPLTPQDLEKDMEQLVQMLPSSPIIIARPLAAGLGLVWAARVESVKGLISIGNAQRGVRAAHIFYNHNPHTYLLARYARKLSPRPLAIIKHEGHPLGGDEDELNTLMQSSLPPHRLERTSEITPTLLHNLVRWVQAEAKR